jgi:hypothetical protein
MPRVPDGILESVFYLYETAQDADNGEHNGGTGFLVSVQRDDQSPKTLYAVSNRHVVGPAPLGHATVARVNTADGNYEILDALTWKPHDDGDDVAIARIELGTESVYSSIRSTQLLRPDDLDIGTSASSPSRIFGPGNEVLLVGRSADHEGRERNYPVVRFGNIAMMPSEPIGNELGFDQESFIVESRSFGGFSGSPVIVYPEAFITEDGVFDTYVGMRTWLLGIVWGHADLFQRVLESDQETPHQDKLWVKQNSGLMYVVPSWKLLDMLMTDEEIAFRAKRDRDWDEENAT